jgi:putative hemolysin
MGPGEIILLLVLPVLLGFTALCSASETALFGLTYHDRVRLRKLSPSAAAATATLTARPTVLLVALMLATNVAGVLYFVCGTLLLLRLESSAVGVVIKYVALLGMIVGGEVLPKLLVERARAEFCRAAAPTLLAAFRIAAPACVLVEAVTTPLARLFAPNSAQQTQLTPEDLGAMVRVGAEQGAVDAQEQQVLAEVVELGALKVRDVMTPRVSMVWVEEAMTPAQVAKLVRSSSQTRLPVRRKGDESAAVGMLLGKQYLATWAQGKPARIGDFLVPARYVPETARLDKLLDLFRATGANVALCVDEDGSIVGQVQIEDVVRRLVRGLMQSDAAASAVTPQAGEGRDDAVQMVGLGRWSVPGRLSVRRWAQMFGQTPDPRVATVAGLVQAMLQRIPKVGDRVVLGNLVLEVDAVSRNTVERLTVSVASGDDAPGDSRANAGGAQGGSGQ